MKDDNKPYEVKWKILNEALPYSVESGRCGLCMQEKLMIMNTMEKHPKNTINKRHELLGKCIHKRRHLLENLLVKPEGAQGAQVQAEAEQGRQEQLLFHPGVEDSAEGGQASLQQEGEGERGLGPAVEAVASPGRQGQQEVGLDDEILERASQMYEQQTVEMRMTRNQRREFMGSILATLYDPG